MAKAHEHRYEVLIRDRGPKKNGSNMIRVTGDNPETIREFALPVLEKLESAFSATKSPPGATEP